MTSEAIGWSASLVLLATMMRQVWTQWRDHDAGGLSRWLFVGQIAASAGFTAYSLMLGNMIFAITNVLMLLNSLIGLHIDRRNRREARSR